MSFSWLSRTMTWFETSHLSFKAQDKTRICALAALGNGLGFIPTPGSPREGNTDSDGRNVCCSPVVSGDRLFIHEKKKKSEKKKYLSTYCVHCVWGTVNKTRPLLTVECIVHLVGTDTKIKLMYRGVKIPWRKVNPCKGIRNARWKVKWPGVTVLGRCCLIMDLKGMREWAKVSIWGRGVPGRGQRPWPHIFPWLFKKHNEEVRVAVQVRLCAPTTWFKFQLPS